MDKKEWRAKANRVNDLLEMMDETIRVSERHKARNPESSKRLDGIVEMKKQKIRDEFYFLSTGKENKI